MTSLTLSLFGPPEQKHVVKVPPMQTLKDAIQAASIKFKPALVADQCELHLNKKAVDLNTPFRLLNIPGGSKLDIIKRAATSPAAAAPASTSAVSAAAAATPSAVAAADNVVSAPAAAPEPAAGPAAPRPPAPAQAAAGAQQQAVYKTQSAAVQPTTTEPKGSKEVAFTETPAAASEAAGPGPSSIAATAAAAPAADVPPALAALGIQRAVYVFHQRTLEAAASAAQSSSAMDVDPPDEFFELTVEDLARMQQQAKAKKQQEAVFRTRAAREAEEARAAAAMGPVRVRLHFPDSMLLQSEFRATEPLSAVQDLVHRCAAAQYAPALYLYTTPPKTVLKGAGTLYQLQLVPAAHIYVGVDEKKVPAASAAAASTEANSTGFQVVSPYLKPEVQALIQDHVPEQLQQQKHTDELMQDSAGASSDAAAVAEAQRAMRAAAAASRAEARGGDAAGGSKVPKWLKVGKK